MRVETLLEIGIVAHQVAVNETVLLLFQHAEQFNGREGETATFLSRCLFTLMLHGFGFAPRHLNRSAAIVFLLPSKTKGDMK